ncbi:T9SS type A sorting domain-containing protein [Carboxylicivirga sediminis]|uniref:T9SS type A sorting domain-containing protein n=1 Tax=Carboxylicivirga sediminis TaxID=2006564 RepID=A0A941F4H7_9BACT|nr:T9SS type A sorting domain-containing protein [Carboxylicivirga sediminis]MBR8536688.1 T9SS type A sorting domain-containing protein [Carboxylicivirga sediminis]
MKKQVVFKKRVMFYLSLLLSLNLMAQKGSLYQVSLVKQIELSSLVIEGRVLDKMSLWDKAGAHIYTIHRVEVFKTFKGSTMAIVKIVTAGGLVDDSFEHLSDQPNMQIGDCGVFMLKASKLNLSDAPSVNHSTYEVLSACQGFYRYDIAGNMAANALASYKDITGYFYQNIQSVTKENYSIIKPFALEEMVQMYGLKSTTAITISSLSPTQVSAGTQTTLVITGSGFGSAPGRIGFKNANDGGATYFDAQPSELQSWNDTQIEVFIPSHAGTGTIRVTNASAETEVSTDAITITYAHTNLLYSDKAIMTQLIDVDGQGGYLWHMYTAFNQNNSAKEAFTRAFNTWVCASKVNWRLGLPTTNDVTMQDGENVIRFDNGDELPLGVLGRCISYGFQCGDPEINAIVEMDMIINDTEDWYFGTGMPGASQFDFETVVLHELGHGLQLGHVIESDDVMYYGLGEGSTKRQLSLNDEAGANYVQTKSKAIPICFFSVVTDGECLANSIDEQVLYDGLQIYPNPASSVLNIKVDVNIKLNFISVVDIDGQKLITIPMDNIESEYSLDISRLAGGIYFLNVNSDKANISKRFVVN